MSKMRFLRSSKCPKTAYNSTGQPLELTQKLTTGKKTSYSWYSYTVSVGYYFAKVIEGL